MEASCGRVLPDNGGNWGDAMAPGTRRRLYIMIPTTNDFTLGFPEHASSKTRHHYITDKCYRRITILRPTYPHAWPTSPFSLTIL